MSGSAASFDVAVRGIGVLMPGLASWPAACAVLRGEAPYQSAAAVLPPPPRLPPAERRRAGPSVRLAMAVADEAVAQAGADPQQLPTVFASSGGEGSNCHVLCETLAGPDRQISPTRFTNSVHNAPAGYWHIAVGSRVASTSLSAYDGSFCAGLLEAVTQVAASGDAVLLVALDVPYPEPLHRLRPLPHHAGVALLLAPATGTADPTTRLSIALVDAGQAAAPTRCADAGLDALRQAIPAAAALPLLEAIANGAGERRLVLDYLPNVRLEVTVATPAASP